MAFRFDKQAAGWFHCVVAIDGNQVAGFNAISFGRVSMPLVRTDRTFRAQEAWSDQITVSKNYRGKGLATDLRLEAFKFLSERGIKKFYGGTLPANIPNRKLSRKVGFQELGNIRYKKLLMHRKWSFERTVDEIS
jgi:RimJ/RimL family protein N-acetyltransferase